MDVDSANVAGKFDSQSAHHPDQEAAGMKAKAENQVEDESSPEDCCKECIARKGWDVAEMRLSPDRKDV